MVMSESPNLTRFMWRVGSALIAMLFGVLLAGTAEAYVYKTTATNSLGQVTIEYKDVDNGIIYLITREASPECGYVTKTDLHTDPPLVDVYQFTGSDGDGCNPIDLKILEGGEIEIITDSGGQYGGGTTQTFTSSALDLVSTVPLGTSPAAPKGPNDTKALKHMSRPGSSTNIFVTGNTAVYELAVDASGNLSPPIPIHTFSTSGTGGFAPYGQAVLGADGNLYGTTEQGGAKRNGVVYELSPVTVGTTTTWTYTVLYTFKSKADGGRPIGDIAIDLLGNLYGTTSLGGMSGGAFTPCGANGFPGPVNAGCGVVFELVNKGAVTPWTERVLWTFTGGTDGATPEAGVVLDPKGRIYGTTFAGGNTSLAACSGSAIQNADPGCGVVFELSGKRFSRTETVLHAFMGGTDGAEPMGPVQLAGKDIYGSTAAGGDTADEGCNAAFGVAYANGCGVVFELTP